MSGRPPIRTPEAAGTGVDLRATEMPWLHWQELMAQMTADTPRGWSPCRFGVRIGFRSMPDRTEFVFGVVRGPLGVFNRDYPICLHGDLAEELTEPLSSICHLPSGIGIGLFANREVACAAADTLLATNAGIPWSDLMNSAFEASAKVGTVWGFNGFGIEDHRHAHYERGAPEMAIWNRVQTPEQPTGKPS